MTFCLGEITPPSDSTGDAGTSSVPKKGASDCATGWDISHWPMMFLPSSYVVCIRMRRMKKI